MKVYVVGSATHYTNFLEGSVLVSTVEDADVVLFTGGEDVDPSIYGCKKHSTTYSNLQRDVKEKELFGKIRQDQLALGICRGSQFLCVMNGGILVQDCTNHASSKTHPIDNGEVMYEITSTHHQMQYPYNLPSTDYDLLYKSSIPLSNRYSGDQINSDLIESNGEPEIVLYHKDGLPKCLAVQGHPEMIPTSPVSKMISNLVKELINHD